MESDTFLEVASRSERVRNLLATSIRAGVRIQLGTSIGPQQAQDLARSHTLDTAISTIMQKLQVHESLDIKTRNEIAVTEAAIESSGKYLSKQARKEAIIAIRKTALEKTTDRVGDRQTIAELQERLVHLRDEISLWSSDFRKFLRGFTELYRLRQKDLQAMGLPKEVHSDAVGEIDYLFISRLMAFAEGRQK